MTVDHCNVECPKCRSWRWGYIGETCRTEGCDGIMCAKVLVTSKDDDIEHALSAIEYIGLTSPPDSVEFKVNSLLALKAEIERLTRERDQWARAAGGNAGETERLRAALTSIAAFDERQISEAGKWLRAYASAKDALSAAPAQPDKPKYLYYAAQPEGAADTRREVLLDKTLRQYAHQLRIEACSAWSDVVQKPIPGLDHAKCDYAKAIEDRLKAVIDELADLASGRIHHETKARQRYSVTGKFIPLSENGVEQIGLLGIVNIAETNHAVVIVDDEFPDTAKGDGTQLKAGKRQP